MQASYNRLYEYLCSISPISTLEFKDFYAIFKEITIKKGDYFARQGRVEKNFGILLNGVVRTFYKSQSGEEQIKSFATHYAFIGGFSSLISKDLNHIDVQAITDCIILSGSYNQVIELYNKHPNLETLARKLLESLFVFKEKREIELLSLTAEGRYLRFRDQYEALETIIPQYHIASYLGITPTQLSRIRRKLKTK